MIAAVLLFVFAVGQPPDAGSLNEKATASARLGRPEEAEKLWKQALEASPDFFPALFNLGFQCHARGQFEEAEKYLARAARLRPADFNTLYLLGSARVNQGRSEAGLIAWRAALALQPANTKLMQIMAVEYGKGRYFREAADVARRAVGPSSDANAHFIAVKACQDAHEPCAMEMARRAVEKFPTSARANFEYGYHLQKAGRPDQAMPYLEKAMSADPKYEEPFFFYGDSLLREDQFAEAVRYLRIAIENRPDYVPAAVSLAKALMGLEKYEEAEQVLNQAASLSPKHPQPHLLMSQLYFRMGDEERARREKEISSQLRRLDPTLMETPQGRPFPAAQTK